MGAGALFPVAVAGLVLYMFFSRSDAIDFAIEHSTAWRRLRKVRYFYIVVQFVFVGLAMWAALVVACTNDFGFLFLAAAFLLLAVGMDPPEELESRLMELRARDESPSVEHR